MNEFIASIKNPGKLLIAVVIAHAAGLVGSVFTVRSVDTWYTTLAQPYFAPPSWLFGPVWLTLYTLMGIAAYLVWQKWQSDAESRVPLVIYFLHLILNAFWSIVFFGFRDPGTAFVVIMILLAIIFYLTLAFSRTDTYAGYLMVPYLTWVGFASFLNYYIWILN